MEDNRAGKNQGNQMWFAIAWTVLAVILMVRLVTGLVIISNPERSLWPDSVSYLTLARNLLAGDGYQGNPGSGVDLSRTPGYPVFLASVFLFFGESYSAVVFVQLAMGGIISLALFWVGREHLSPRAGYFAALLYALTPNAILWSLSILSDTLFVLCITLACMPVAYFLREVRGRWAVISGALIGLSALVRPISSVLVPLWAILLAGYNIYRKRSLREGFLIGAMFIAASAVFIVPWVVRNSLVWDRPMLSSIAIWNLGRYQAPAALARAKGISLEEARGEIPTSHIPQPGDAQRYLRVILDYPLDYLTAHLHGTRLIMTEAGQPNLAQLVGVHYRGSGVFSAFKESGIKDAVKRLLDAWRGQHQRWLFIGTVVALIFQAFSYLFAVIGGIHLWRSGSDLRWLGLMFILTSAAFILIPGPVGNGRFRLPAEPFLALLAAAGISSVLGWLDKCGVVRKGVQPVG